MFLVARHVIDIELRNPVARGSCIVQYGGTCSCGWKGEDWLTRGMAWADARSHKQDACMSQARLEALCGTSAS